MQAFDGHAFGYLVKPITDGRLREALREAKAYIKGRRLLGTDPNRIFRILDVNQDRMLIKTEGRFIFLRTQEIDWIHANRNYVRIHVGEASYLHRQTIASLERHLDPARFLRIHRSAIVNIDKIRELRPWPTGEYVVLMRSGKELTLSRIYRARLPFFAGETSPLGGAQEGQPSSTISDFSSLLRNAQDRTMPSREISKIEVANRPS